MRDCVVSIDNVTLVAISSEQTLPEYCRGPVSLRSESVGWWPTALSNHRHRRAVVHLPLQIRVSGQSADVPCESTLPTHNPLRAEMQPV